MHDFERNSCGLANKASATLVIISATPTISAITTSSSTPYATTGGYSSNYRNVSDYSLYNPNNMFGKTATALGAVPGGNPFVSSGNGNFAGGAPTLGSSTDQGEQNDISPLVATNYGGSVSANVIVYAQRDTTPGDQVSQINLWFSNSPFTVGYTPNSGSTYVLNASQSSFAAGAYAVNGSSLSSLGSPAESITITDTSDQKLNEYDFPDSTTQSGQYVLMQFVDSAAAASSSSEGNPGAQEFALGIDSTVPEPASLSAGAITLGLLGLRRRRRV